MRVPVREPLEAEALELNVKTQAAVKTSLFADIALELSGGFKAQPRWRDDGLDGLELLEHFESEIFQGLG